MVFERWINYRIYESDIVAVMKTNMPIFYWSKIFCCAFTADLTRQQNIRVFFLQILFLLIVLNYNGYRLSYTNIRKWNSCLKHNSKNHRCLQLHDFYLKYNFNWLVSKIHSTVTSIHDKTNYVSKICSFKTHLRIKINHHFQIIFDYMYHI